MAIILGVIEPVAHQKRGRGLEADESELGKRRMLLDLVEESADRQGDGSPLGEERQQAPESVAAVDDVLDQHDVLAGEIGLGIVEEVDVAARDRAAPVRARDQKVDLKG